MNARFAPLVLVGVLLGAPDAAAQTGGLPFRDGSGSIEIAVDGSVEWQQKKRVFVARGNARARQGDVTLRAETITAHYRTGEDGGTEIWRIDAEGAVRIAGNDQVATGGKGTYDVDKQLLVLTGKPKFTSGAERISASRSLEYSQALNRAVARGNAVAMREDRTIKAETLTATFEPGGKESDKLRRLVAVGRVVFTSPDEVFHADRADFDAVGERLKLEGSVRISQGGNELRGQSAVLNLKTGTSRMLGGEGGVQGVFVPPARPVPENDTGREGKTGN
ncbi:MAG: hypothetical protein OYH76_25005 [Defluviicoccus sp.]|nr:hypothetical protein [Defluviicoccus sp.]MDE0279168.1 hypothetical protein [Defluviicoccus sp.]